jgi:hypothetical protein
LVSRDPQRFSASRKKPTRTTNRRQNDRAIFTTRTDELCRKIDLRLGPAQPGPPSVSWIMRAVKISHSFKRSGSDHSQSIDRTRQVWGPKSQRSEDLVIAERLRSGIQICLPSVVFRDRPIRGQRWHLLAHDQAASCTTTTYHRYVLLTPGTSLQRAELNPDRFLPRRCCQS